MKLNFSQKRTLVKAFVEVDYILFSFSFFSVFCVFKTEHFIYFVVQTTIIACIKISSSDKAMRLSEKDSKRFTLSNRKVFSNRG